MYTYLTGWFQSRTKFFIIATDGVWEFISSQDAVEIVQECFENGLGASDACKKLIRVAMDKWKEIIEMI